MSEIAKETSYSAEVQLLDLSSFDSVTAFARRLEGQPIDIYVANAAVASMDYVETKDGWEQWCVPTYRSLYDSLTVVGSRRSLQVNHLSTSLLTFLLVPNLSKAASLHGSSSRVVIVSSGAAFASTFDDEFMKGDFLAKLNDKDLCVPQMMAHRYPDTKCECSLFIYILYSPQYLTTYTRQC